jgi:hypothetical protein
MRQTTNFVVYIQKYLYIVGVVSFVLLSLTLFLALKTT